MRTTSAGPPALLAAILTLAVIAFPSRSRAQTSDGPDERITQDGLQCGTTSYDVDWLSPSIDGSNELRRDRLRTLLYRATTLMRGAPQLCPPGRGQPGVPGCTTIMAWAEAQKRPWPTAGDFSYIPQRMERMSNDDDMAADSLRAMAHRTCLDEMADLSAGELSHPPIRMPEDETLCAALVDAEEKSDPTLKEKLEGLLVAPAKGAPPASGPALVAPVWKVLSGVEKDIEKTFLHGGSLPDAVKARVPVAAFYGELWCAMHASERPSQAFAKICGDHFPIARTSWAKSSAAIVSAARALGPFEPEPSWKPEPADTGGEFAAIEKRIEPSACRGADFYVAPTHQVVRRNIDHVVPEIFTVCVDTAGFSIEEPVEVEISTPSAQQVEWLWPGERKEIHAHMSGQSNAQVMHLTISGYPRREVLRAVARNKGGPLEHYDVFAYITGAADAAAKQKKSDSKAHEGKPPNLDLPATPSPLTPDPDTAALELCDITWVLVPLVSEDILVEGRAAKLEEKNPYILEYDFGAGFQVATRDRLQESVPIFAIVRNVQPGWSVGIAINNKAVVQRDATIVGLTKPVASASPFNERASASRPGFDQVNALAIEAQPASTQILALGYLSGGARYDITVCASDGLYDDCASDSPSTTGPTPPPDSSKTTPTSGTSPNHRIIAKNSLTVHANHYIGARAGLGFVESYGGFQDLVSEPGIGGSVVRHRPQDTDVAVPLLLAVYPFGRDATEMPPLLGGGLVAGLDLTKISENPRLYGGIVLDVYGFGLTFAASLERTPYVENAAASVIGSPSSAQIDNVWRWGALWSVTTDLDIFQTIFQSYFKAATFPSVTQLGTQ